MLGVFCTWILNWQLCVYWKQLPIGAAIISSSQTKMKLIQRPTRELQYHMKMWLDRFIVASHIPREAYVYQHTLVGPSAQTENAFSELLHAIHKFIISNGFFISSNLQTMLMNIEITITTWQNDTMSTIYSWVCSFSLQITCCRQLHNWCHCSHKCHLKFIY